MRRMIYAVAGLCFLNTSTMAQDAPMPQLKAGAMSQDALMPQLRGERNACNAHTAALLAEIQEDEGAINQLQQAVSAASFAAHQAAIKAAPTTPSATPSPTPSN